MERWQDLADAVIDEDRRLRRLLTACPVAGREQPGPDGALSFKETLAHITFWDEAALVHLQGRADPARRTLAAPADLDAQGREAVARARQRPFGEVLAGYLEITGALVAFIAREWERLGPREREGLAIPLQHRRYHRQELERMLPDHGGRAVTADGAD
ncbi:MAG: hypothetical protein R6X35_14040 [Candidatus Krumholzibacteriia bacterium]